MMAKEEKKPEGEKGKSGGKKKLHLHEIRSTYAKDGSIVHHHTYKDHIDSPLSHPERGPMATSADADEAGQHVAEQFGMNQMGGGDAAAAGGAGEEQPGAAGGAAPMPGA
jgi:hypothetical protein